MVRTKQNKAFEFAEKWQPVVLMTIYMATSFIGILTGLIAISRWGK